MAVLLHVGVGMHRTEVALGEAAVSLYREAHVVDETGTCAERWQVTASDRSVGI